MFAMVADAFGAHARLHLLEKPVPKPGPEQVLVRMAYAGANPADWKLRAGWMLRFPQFQPDLPFTLGFDGAGVVALAGDVAAAQGWAAGQRVFVRANQMLGHDGTFADFALVALTGIARIPDTVSLHDAATVPTAGLTAYQALLHGAGLQAGQTVLVNGGAGGCGSFAIQFARAMGAHVAATGRAANHAYMRQLGADCVIDYQRDDVAKALRHWAPEGVDVLLDTVNLGTLPGAMGMVKPGGVLVGIATLDAEAQDWTAQAAAEHGIRLVQFTAMRAHGPADLEAIGALMAAGAVTAPPSRVLPLSEANAALDEIRAGHVRGKLLLAIPTTT